LQVSDHFYYMCTKYFSDGDVHKYFNPYNSPYDSYINFMNVLGNLQRRCHKISKEQATSLTPQQKAAGRFLQVGSYINQPSDLQPASSVAPINQE
jgi:hypothetical protein